MDRIDELIRQATHDCMGVPLLDQRQLAQLIVKECAEVCYHHSKTAGGVDTALGYGYKDCGDDVKRHFGLNHDTD
jgi:hypothetical protein